jgi:hypothetical protein
MKTSPNSGHGVKNRHCLLSASPSSGSQFRGFLAYLSPSHKSLSLPKATVSSWPSLIYQVLQWLPLASVPLSSSLHRWLPCVLLETLVTLEGQDWDAHGSLCSEEVFGAPG